jgi:hypothetical protein
MKKIGFIDLHIDEWHANNYPIWFREAKRGGEFEVHMAWEESPAAGLRPLADWCRDFQVKPGRSAEEVVASCDCLCVLAPSNPEAHERLAALPLASGKPVYMDKPFAPSRAAAERLFALADRHHTPLFSSSALRFGDELIAARRTLAKPEIDAMMTWGGGRSFEEYAIHQLEMIVSTMGGGVRRVMRYGGGPTDLLALEFADRRRATVALNPRSPFGCHIFGGEAPAMLNSMSTIFPNLIAAILDFFADGTIPVDRKETIEIAGVLDAGIRAGKTPGVWLNVD